MARTRGATTGPPQSPNAIRRTDDARGFCGNGMGGFTLCRCFIGVSIIQQLIGSFVECCRVVAYVLAWCWHLSLYHSIDIKYYKMIAQPETRRVELSAVQHACTVRLYAAFVYRNIAKGTLL